MADEAHRFTDERRGRARRRTRRPAPGDILLTGEEERMHENIMAIVTGRVARAGAIRTAAREGRRSS